MQNLEMAFGGKEQGSEEGSVDPGGQTRPLVTGRPLLTALERASKRLASSDSYIPGSRNTLKEKYFL